MPKQTVPMLAPPRETQRQEKGNSSRRLQPKLELKLEVRTRPGGGTGTRRLGWAPELLLLPGAPTASTRSSEQLASLWEDQPLL